MSFQDVVGKPKGSSSSSTIRGTTTITSTSSLAINGGRGGGGGGGGYPYLVSGTTTTTTSAAATAAAAPTSAPLPTALWTMSTSSSTNTTAMSQISDSLTQYQRNVGILEKIAMALLTTTASMGTTVSQQQQQQQQQPYQASRTELETQYKAQSDVLRQLEQRLREQILSQRQRFTQNSNQDDSSSTQKQALLKLERDFERVQTSVQATKAKVSRQLKQYQQRQAALAHVNNNHSSTITTIDNTTTTSHTFLQQQYAQQQLQLQQDRLQEEIMREREDEIRKINRGMHQVNEIYKDLAHIVGSQQEQVDQIEDKMEDARNTAQSGLDQVHKANEKYGTNQCVIS